MTSAKHVETIKPILSKALEAAIKGGSGALDDLNKMLELAKKTNDKALIEGIESRIGNDAAKVKEHFSDALFAVAKELGLGGTTIGNGKKAEKKARKPREKKNLSPEQRTEGAKHLGKVLGVLPQLNADKAKNVGKGWKDGQIQKATGLDLGMVKLARTVGQEQGKIASKGVWGGAFKV